MNRVMLFMVLALVVVMVCFYVIQRSSAPSPASSAKSMAQTFFNVLASGNTDKAAAMFDIPGSPIKSKMHEKDREFFVALETQGTVTIKITGDAVMRDNNPSLWLVPYDMQIKNDFVLPNGTHVKAGDYSKQKLSVRNDNPLRQWFVDGGI